MKKQGISQETLKLIACITMLIDHIGAVFVPGYALRCIGRLSFPIYCFLIAEGSHYTRSPKKYALRMLLMAAASEVGYDLAFYGGFTLHRQNVMLTLLMGFFALEVMKKCPNTGLKIMAAVPFAIVAEFCRSDYGAEGVMVIALFALTRELPHKHLLQFLGMAFIFSSMSSAEIFRIGNFPIQMQELGALAILPIALYSGKKATTSKAVQWGFYLFYPVHLLVLWLIKLI